MQPVPAYRQACLHAPPCRAVPPLPAVTSSLRSSRTAASSRGPRGSDLSRECGGRLKGLSSLSVNIAAIACFAAAKLQRVGQFSDPCPIVLFRDAPARHRRHSCPRPALEPLPAPPPTSPAHLLLAHTYTCSSCIQPLLTSMQSLHSFNCCSQCLGAPNRH